MEWTSGQPDTDVECALLWYDDAFRLHDAPCSMVQRGWCQRDPDDWMG